MNAQRLAILVSLPLAFSALSTTAEAQVTRRIGRAVSREVEKKVKGIAVDAVRCGLGDDDCAAKAKKEGKPVVYTGSDGEVVADENGNPITDPVAAQAQSERPGEGVWRNYDFVPGDSVWRVIDWSEEPVGRFPESQVHFERGNMEIVERNGVKLLEAKGGGSFFVDLPDTLPDAFTLEFMLEIPTNNIGTYVHLAPQSGSLNRNPFHYVYIYGSPGIFLQSEAISSVRLVDQIVGRLTPFKLQVKGSYAILYAGPTRAGMIPNAKFPRSNRIQFVLGGNARFPTYISDIVVRVGLSDLYATLMRDGSVATYAFLFDVDSDRLRPESTPKLEELRAMMADHADLRIAITGHTDDTGDDAHNLELSERRAASVVRWLTGNGIMAERLRAGGRGESEPIAGNDDAVGRAKNRRVEIAVIRPG